MDNMQTLAMMFAVEIRNTMEDFHASHLPNEQMGELNPLIRNAVYTVLLAMKEARNGNQRAIDHLTWLKRMIEPYWEAPVALETFG